MNRNWNWKRKTAKLFVLLRRHYILTGLLLLAAAILFYAFYIEPSRLVLRKYEMTIPKLDPAQDGLKVVVLSDLHIRREWKENGYLDRLVETANAQKPDLIFLPGDFINGMGGDSGNISMPDFTVFLRKFQAKHGVFAVYGNHEFWFGLKKIGDAIRDAGVILLDNDARVLRVNHARLVIAGTAECSTASPDLVKTLRYARHDDPILLLSHNPAILPTIPSWVSLTVSGHTHGGQLRAPFLGSLLMPPSLRSKYEPGISMEGNRPLLLTSGIGGSPIRARICCPPEIVLLTLRAAPNHTPGKNDTPLRQNVTPEVVKK